MIGIYNIIHLNYSKSYVSPQQFISFIRTIKSNVCCYVFILCDYPINLIWCNRLQVYLSYAHLTHASINFIFITNPTLICIIKGLIGKLSYNKTTAYFHMHPKMQECNSGKYDIIRN